jgi:hypothetical protein
MGSVKDRLFSYYERLEYEFVDKHGRDPTGEERYNFWKQAEEQYLDQVDQARRHWKEQCWKEGS